MSYGYNPYILFLILILLILGSDPESVKKVELLKEVMDKTSNAINNFKTGISTLSADFGEIHFMLKNLEKPSA
ncbi:MAG: hypothetical protein ACOY31_03895 [Bacillota bacterium]